MSAIHDLFTSPIKVINVGLPSFAADLQRQNVPVVHVDWKPPAGGNPRIAALLDRIRRWQAQVRAGKE
ncbi:MAG: hypothetical protein OZSIB_2066 [Candidatus Ozemobacter sibiricus]|jgi:FdrA protein|uniref:FdrA domain protein n=1 Tax=Candidatus Ozemobacter sibiricus TaxID=2268124 RepID=A0A367ZTL9_9BACT|nr:MAG: hypothetical protein OZSIB_2066 [Candidatus Ozemobacter sibiricus]